MTHQMKLWASAAAVAMLTAAAGCSASTSVPSVPSLAGGSAAAASRADLLHLAGQCIRQHGIPGFPDPTLDTQGQVTINKTALLTVPGSVLAGALTSCRAAIDRTGAQVGSAHGEGHAPTPAQLRQLVAFARCMRAHGLPTFADPDPVTGELSLPPGISKLSPVFGRAHQACRSSLPGNG